MTGRSSLSSSARPVVEAHGLVKRFGDVRAVDGTDLTVPAGAVYGLLGPNGAGKTTLIRILATLTRPDSGAARVLGHDVVREADEVRSRVSLTGQFASLDEDLTARENLQLVARLLGLDRRAARARADELLDAFDLAGADRRQVKTFSGGMRRRLDLAGSLVVTPELLFLDEPTTGLDPRSRNQVWKIVGELVADGASVLLTTQYLDEADHLADRIAVLDHGRVIAEGTTGELKASVGAGSFTVRVADPRQRDDAARLLARSLAVEVHRGADDAELVARVSDPNVVANALLALSRAGVAAAEFASSQPSLDEVFLTLTGHTVEVAGADEEEVA